MNIRNEFYNLLVKKSRRDKRVTLEMNDEGQIIVFRDGMKFVIEIKDNHIHMHLESIKLMTNMVYANELTDYQKFNKMYSMNNLCLTVNRVLNDLKTCPLKKDMIKMSNKFVKALDTVGTCPKRLLKDLIDQY